MTGDDAIIVQDIMKTFLRLNQRLGADNVGSNVTIEVADVLVEDIIPRSPKGDGEVVLASTKNRQRSWMGHRTDDLTQAAALWCESGVCQAGRCHQ